MVHAQYYTKLINLCFVQANTIEWFRVSDIFHMSLYMFLHAIALEIFSCDLLSDDRCFSGNASTQKSSNSIDLKTIE